MRVPTLSARAFRHLTALNVALLMVIVVSGAIVRLSGSGLGCDDWPNCNADAFVSISDTHSAVEQLNRLFSGAIVIPLLLTLLASMRRAPARPDLVRYSWAMLAVYLTNAVLGGISVLVDLQWTSVTAHFLLAIVLVGLALTAHRRAAEPPGPYRAVVDRTVTLGVRTVYGLTVWVLLLGTLVTAAGPHGGDERASRLGWQIPDLARAHAVSVDVLVALVLGLVVLLARRRAPRPVLRAASLALGAMVVQGVIGYVQYAQAIPALLVGFHVAGAVIVFGAVHWLALSIREAVPAPSTAAPAVEEASPLVPVA